MNINDLKEARLNANLSQRIFCEITGVPLGSLRNWEQGLSTPPEYVISLLIDKINEYAKEHVKENTHEPSEYYYISMHHNAIYFKIWFVSVSRDDFFDVINNLYANNVIMKYTYVYEGYTEEHYYSDEKDIKQHIGYIKTYML